MQLLFCAERVDKNKTQWNKNNFPRWNRRLISHAPAKQRNPTNVHIQQMGSPSQSDMYARMKSINFDMHGPYYNIFIDFCLPPTFNAVVIPTFYSLSLYGNGVLRHVISDRGCYLKGGREKRILLRTPPLPWCFANSGFFYSYGGRCWNSVLFYLNKMQQSYTNLAAFEHFFVKCCTLFPGHTGGAKYWIRCTFLFLKMLQNAKII